jgi:hypothetical protein
VPLVDRASVVHHAWHVLGGRRTVRLRGLGRNTACDLEVGVAFVVPKQDVVFGLERLDQVVFQQQRFRLGAHHRRFEPRDLADHVADARAAVVFLEITRHPLFQVDGLADIQHLLLRVEVAVDARQSGQGRHLLQNLGRVHRLAVGRGVGCSVGGRSVGHARIVDNPGREAAYLGHFLPRH